MCPKHYKAWEEVKHGTFGTPMSYLTFSGPKFGESDGKNDVLNGKSKFEHTML